MTDPDIESSVVQPVRPRRWEWRPKVRWFASEIVIVVAGVLIALALNAWWQQKQQDRAERDLVLALLDEFVINQTRVDEILAFHRDLKTTVGILLDESAQEEPSIPAESVDQLLADVSWWASYVTLESTTMDAAVVDGQLSLIQTDSLRRLLATWRSAVDAAGAMSSQEFAYHTNTWLALLTSHADIAQFANKASTIPGSNQPYQGASIPLAATTVDHRPLIRTRIFRNVLVQKLWIEDDVIYQYDKLVPLARRTIAALQREVR